MRIASVFHRGLFLPEIGQTGADGEAGLVIESSDVLQPSDIVSDSIIFKNTEYRKNMIVVLSVISQDRIITGWIKKVILRENKVFFLVSVKHCCRTEMRYFQSLDSRNQVEFTKVENLKSFKPLIPRGIESSYVFFLNGKLVDDFTG